jgi:hypothetical protein
MFFQRIFANSQIFIARQLFFINKTTEWVALQITTRKTETDKILKLKFAILLAEDHLANCKLTFPTFFR